jgi:two-component system sensor histidine kinase ChvG
MAVESTQPVDGWGMAYIGQQWRRLMKAFARAGIYYKFTTIAGRIVALNILSLLILVGGMLYLSDFRDRLIAARGESLKIEAVFIAKALALEGTPRAPESAHDVILGEGIDSTYGISQEKAAELLRSLIKPTKTHGYVYNADGSWLVDSNRIFQKGKLTQYQNPTKRADEVSWIYRTWLRFEHLLRAESLPKLAIISMQNGKEFAEIKAALEQGSPTLIARENELGETILSYGAPIERGGTVRGALLLTTVDGEIDAMLAEERFSVVRLWLLVALVTAVGSIVLAGTIAGPMRRLAQAARRVSSNIKARESVPDFTHRSDEIGHLARALQEMTTALYARLDSIESFAADVSHELKNPLTSLQSAVETLPLVKRDEDRDRLMQIVRHDVHRLNRLITDISDASRLDAELGRQSRRPLNIAGLLEAVCGAQNAIHRDCPVTIRLQIKGIPRAAAVGNKSPFRIYGHEGRLSQVINNLLDNAISFSPANGTIRIICGLDRKSKEVEIAVEDEGPGIPEEHLEKIFDRFYTDRPEQEDFGKNSGLGLNISRQIVTAHKGRIWAENRAPPLAAKRTDKDEQAQASGARLVIRLPVS